MNEGFVPFELAKKLQEKGFDCEYPFAMYDKYEQFCPLYSSDKYYFRIDDFVKHAFIAPTISQALKWLREEKNIHIEFVAAAYGYNYIVSDTPEKGGTDRHCSAIKYEGPNDGGAWDEYEAAAIAGIEYCLDNLI